jgi:hypothetical protein
LMRFSYLIESCILNCMMHKKNNQLTRLSLICHIA